MKSIFTLFKKATVKLLVKDQCIETVPKKLEWSMKNHFLPQNSFNKTLSYPIQFAIKNRGN